MQNRNRVFLFLFLCSLALFAYTNVRAYRLSFTHDESHSYEVLIHGFDTQWKGTSADHRLNTRLMSWTYRWFGPSEYPLRLPNIVSHALYLGFGLLLLRNLKHASVVLLGFAWLNLDPFLLDFFSLARGYGMASGLSMGALFFLWKAWQREDVFPKFLFSFLSMTCASLGVLANYTWLNLHLPLLCGNLLLLLIERDPLAFRANRPRLLAAGLLAGANVWFLHNVVRELWRLNEIKELGARGQIGFIPDTIGSLIDTYFYQQPFPHLAPASAALKPVLLPLVVAAFVTMAVVLGYRTFKEARLSFPALLQVVLCAAVAVPIGEHYFINLDYPNERIALYYIPLAGVLGVFFLDERVSSLGRRLGAMATGGSLILAGLMALHLFRMANDHHSLTWLYDANTKAAMLDIGRHFGGAAAQRIKVGNDWLFEPSMNYYRQSLPYEWLDPVTRDGLRPEESDVIYCFRESFEGYTGKYTVLERYENPDTMLIRIDR